MQGYYWVIIRGTEGRLGFSENELHEKMKCGFHKKTTSGMPFEEWYEYLENVMNFIAEVRGRRRDIDWRHNEGISYYDLPYAQIDDFLFT